MPKDPFFKFLKLVNFDELTSPVSESSQERSNSEELQLEGGHYNRQEAESF